MSTSTALINQWTLDFVRAVDTRDGTLLAQLIRHRCDKLRYNVARQLDEATIENDCYQVFQRFDGIYGTEMKHFLTHYTKVALCISNNAAPWDDILKKSFKLVDMWMDLYLSQTNIDYNWLVPSLHTLCNLVSRIGLMADRSSEDSGEDEDKDKYMKQVLSNIRSKMGRVRGDVTRHPAYIILLCHSIKGCIQLGNMQMAAGFLKTIESHIINYSRAFRGPLINYRYYLGKLHMQKGDYQEGDEHLSWAFSNTLPNSIKMRKQILECIVVVRIGLGKLPSMQLLQKYDLGAYCDIIRAVKLGDIKLFTETIERHFDTFTSQGTVLCVEQLKYIAYRSLIKNVKQWWNTNVPESKQNMLSVELLTHVLKWQMPYITDQEMLCICVNLIRRGLIKGYVSWERLMIVFSNIEPFPPISSCVL
ncbi:PCI domain family protein [Babesia bovis T2Bo]|uniref:Uncharacterized protein n=1 Tax=Babesia bovis TaxID=5865 RepID=A7AMT8_BABBO|nr:PCI domain family protein [Babesia bovis T2Bo]EDO07872.1 PCI domain family protein [Babesia bovis T2Bo]|eukprot:XP_001611440.1 hypothetical protein [Babesia bovis T2Bo]